MNHLKAPFAVLRDGQRFLEEVKRFDKLSEKMVSLFVSSFVLFAVYGAIMGSFTGPAQALSSAIKLPLLFLATVAICMPTLYVACLLLGAKETVGQYFTLLMAPLAVTAALLVSFAPVTVFFMLTSSHYQFFKLLNVAILGTCGVAGVRFFGRAVRELWGEAASQRRSVLVPWMFLYAFVGSQLGWTLRPFFGAPGTEFEAVREVKGNFYVDVGRSFGEVLGME